MASSVRRALLRSLLAGLATASLGARAQGADAGSVKLALIESLSGLFLGESLGQIGIFLAFILILLFKPSGLLGKRAK